MKNIDIIAHHDWAGRGSDSFESVVILSLGRYQFEHYKWCSSIRTNFCRFSPEGSGFVSKSATFSCVLIYAVLHSSRAQPSRTKWYAMALDFFFNVDAGAVVLASTDWLSPNTNAGSSTGIPIIQSLKQSPHTYSVVCFMATNSLPNVLVSHKVCFFEFQEIGAPFNSTT